MLILGGLASYWGVVAGLDRALGAARGHPLHRAVRSTSEHDAALRFAIVGLVLILLMAFRPQGMFGKKEEMVLGE